jgi:predicted phage-related endonuclease
MKSHLILTPTANMSEAEWHSFRFMNGLGASDIGCVLGLTASWKSPIELWYQKLDPALCRQEENIFMFFGTEQEEWICDKYQYWEGTTKSMMDNFRAGKIIRKVQRVNAYVQNPQFPWLFVSLDRKINKDANGEEGLLEAKWISGWVANKFVGGIPPSHMAQVQTQLLVTEITHGDLATVVDGHSYDVYGFKPDNEIADIIVDRTKDFWDRVLAGRIIVTQIHEATINYNGKLKQKLEADLAALEPALIGGEAEETFLKDKYKKSLDKSIGVVKGTDEDLKVARGLKDIKEQIKELTEQASLKENILKRKIGEGVALDFGKQGKVSWQGNPRRFSNQIKL